MYFKDLTELTNAVGAGEINTLKKAIMAKCIDCSCYETAEVKRCTVNTCPLWQFRNGKNPYSKRVMTDEQKAAAAERMRNARLAKNATLEV